MPAIYSTYVCSPHSTQALDNAAESVEADEDGKRARHDAAQQRAEVEAKEEEMARYQHDVVWPRRRVAVRNRRCVRRRLRRADSVARARVTGSGATEASRVARHLGVLSAEVTAHGGEPPLFASRAARQVVAAAAQRRELRHAVLSVGLLPSPAAAAAMLPSPLQSGGGGEALELPTGGEDSEEEDEDEEAAADEMDDGGAAEVAVESGGEEPAAASPDDEMDDDAWREHVGHCADVVVHSKQHAKTLVDVCNGWLDDDWRRNEGKAFAAMHSAYNKAQETQAENAKPKRPIPPKAAHKIKEINKARSLLMVAMTVARHPAQPCQSDARVICNHKYATQPPALRQKIELFARFFNSPPGAALWITVATEGRTLEQIERAKSAARQAKCRDGHLAQQTDSHGAKDSSGSRKIKAGLPPSQGERALLAGLHRSAAGVLAIHARRLRHLPRDSEAYHKSSDEVKAMLERHAKVCGAAAQTHAPLALTPRGREA